MTTLTPSALAARVGRMEQLASIRRLVVDDGQGRGMRVIEVTNGSGLTFTLYPDRGLDIGQAFFKGTPLAWVTGNLEVAPAFYDGTGAEWLRTWGGGLLTGCGLSNVGGPCTRDGESHGLHGRLSHLPAEEVNTAADWSDDGRYTLSVSGRMRQAKAFAENLVLTRRLSTTMGSSSLTIRDTVENRGFREAPCMLLYHINLGWPLVDEGAVLEAAPHNVEPQTDHAAKGMDTWSQITAPIPGAAEQVYYHTLPPDADGLARMCLKNSRLGLSFTVTYRVAELPWIIQWKMMGEGEYVLGLEPANCYPEGQERFAQRGLLKHLAPGESFETYLRLDVEEIPVL